MLVGDENGWDRGNWILSDSAVAAVVFVFEVDEDKGEVDEEEEVEECDDFGIPELVKFCSSDKGVIGGDAEEMVEEFILFEEDALPTEDDVELIELIEAEGL